MFYLGFVLQKQSRFALITQKALIWTQENQNVKGVELFSRKTVKKEATSIVTNMYVVYTFKKRSRAIAL